QYLTVDMGGTNLRVCNVILTEEKGGYKITQSKFKLPGGLKTGNAKELWEYIADLTQANIRHGVLQRWTKGWDVSGVEGEDVVAQLEEAFAERNVPVHIVALVNDTTGTLIASAYKDPEIKIGSIFGTGCNSAYMEKIGRVPKISEHHLPADQLVAINTEYGAFDNSHRVLPRCQFDLEIDLGFLENMDLSRLRHIHAMESSCVSRMEEAGSAENSAMAETRNFLKENFGIEPTLEELRVCCRLGEIVCTRAARLYACGIAAICKKEGIRQGRVGVDGSTFEKLFRFKERAVAALREILEWPDDSKDLITFVPAEDGSGIGAALIAALSGKE
ncbi:hypothetical protein ASPNIDRAFT_134301, partial [Aspergillus niger ATCC 1015]